MFVNFSLTLDSSGVSQAVDLSGCAPLGIRTPASMVGTSLTFLVSDSLNGTYLPFRDASNADISVTIDGTARHYQLDPAKMAGAAFLKVKSSSTSDNAKVLTLATRPI